MTLAADLPAGMTSPWLRQSLRWVRLRPAFRSGLWVLMLFALGLWATRHYADPIRAGLQGHAAVGVVLYVASSAFAVVMPLATNLPLVPMATLAWGTGWAAAWLLVGWVIGSALSFALGRHARGWILRRFPSMQRHADIDRLIHPRWRLASLVSLRMTFPVDVLSYALGLFSRSTSMGEVVLSTAIGAAPFALLFAWFPAMSGGVQVVVLAASVAVFLLHLWWVMAARAGTPTDGSR